MSETDGAWRALPSLLRVSRHPKFNASEAATFGRQAKSIPESADFLFSDSYFKSYADAPATPLIWPAISPERSYHMQVGFVTTKIKFSMPIE